jgi:hypothetical protein
LKHSFGLHDPGGSLMLGAESGYRLEATIRLGQIDIEGVVTLLDDLKAGGIHDTQYGMAQPELHSGLACVQCPPTSSLQSSRDGFKKQPAGTVGRGLVEDGGRPMTICWMIATAFGLMVWGW